MYKIKENVCYYISEDGFLRHLAKSSTIVCRSCIESRSPLRSAKKPLASTGISTFVQSFLLDSFVLASFLAVWLSSFSPLSSSRLLVLVLSWLLLFVVAVVVVSSLSEEFIIKTNFVFHLVATVVFFREVLDFSRRKEERIRSRFEERVTLR